MIFGYSINNIIPWLITTIISAIAIKINVVEVIKYFDGRKKRELIRKKQNLCFHIYPTNVQSDSKTIKIKSQTAFMYSEKHGEYICEICGFSQPVISPEGETARITKMGQEGVDFVTNSKKVEKIDKQLREL